MQDLARDNKTLQALAFCVGVKVLFVNSEITNFTYRRVKALFGVGNDKLIRLIKTAERLGLLTFDGKTLKVDRLRLVDKCDKKSKEICMCFFTRCASYSKTPDNKLQLSMREITDRLRQLALLWHISRQNDYENTSLIAASEDVSPKLRKKMTKRLKCMSNSDKPETGLSQVRIGQVMSCNPKKAHALTKKLIGGKMLECRHRIEETSIDPNKCDCNALNRMVPHTYKDNGWYFYSNEKKLIMHRKSNEYKVRKVCVFSIQGKSVRMLLPHFNL